MITMDGIRSREIHCFSLYCCSVVLLLLLLLLLFYCCCYFYCVLREWEKSLACCVGVPVVMFCFFCERDESGIVDLILPPPVLIRVTENMREVEARSSL